MYDESNEEITTSRQKVKALSLFDLQVKINKDRSCKILPAKPLDASWDTFKVVGEIVLSILDLKLKMKKKNFGRGGSFFGEVGDALPPNS